MTAVALLTPTYARDLELCTLLCESVDRHVTPFAKHYLLVPDSDHQLFSRFISDRRAVIPASAFLPAWLRPMPRMFQRKRRQFWWSLRAKPASGWHVQQILKIAAAMALPHERYCILDSDIVFFRDFNLSRYEAPNTLPLFRVTNEITADQASHSRWVATSHQLLGLPAPPLPAPDYIGHIIFWDRDTTRAMVSRIEKVTGRSWVEALCQTRDFSEYMLYGYFAESDPASAAAHSPVASTPCVSYWEAPRLDKAGLSRLFSRASRHDVAFSVASFSLTPVEVIRAAIMENEATLAPLVSATEPMGLRAGMLIGQASINLTANVLSAALGLLSVFVFTRLFSPHDYGVYLLGVGFASVISVFLAGWFRNLVLSGHARNDGTEVRGLIASGFILVCFSTPLAFALARLIGLDSAAALAAVALSIAIGLFDLTQDLIRARLMAFSVMRGTLVRSTSVLCLGVIAALVSPTGLQLLLAATAACVLAILIQSRAAWRGTRLVFGRAELAALARQGLPLTLSLTLLAISSVTDRFMIANLVGPADAGKYVAALDLVRQTLMLPAMSTAAAFFPLAVRIQARQGDVAVRAHFAECAELLFGITLPAALGFAMISWHVANVVLGVDFREIAAQTMPIVAVAVIFQIMTQQYLHASFLLSGRNGFYLINTAAIIVANVVLSYVLVRADGAVGAAWARLGADLTGFVCALALTRLAFPVPLPAGRLGLIMLAGLIMALIVAALDRELHVSHLAACIVLGATGAVTYAALGWLFDISHARRRLRSGLALLRAHGAKITIGPSQ